MKGEKKKTFLFQKKKPLRGQYTLRILISIILFIHFTPLQPAMYTWLRNGFRLRKHSD